MSVRRGGLYAESSISWNPRPADPAAIDAERGAACLEYSGDLSDGLDYEVTVNDSVDAVAAPSGGDSNE